MKLPADFYLDNDVVGISRRLLGKLLCTRIDGKTCKVIVTETEAYAGETDKASHAFGGRRTARTEAMYGPGGHAYVYLCYGIHHLFNVVTNVAGIPHAILVRAALRHSGLPVLLARRRQTSAGPQALGITTVLTRSSLRGRQVWLEDVGIAPTTTDIVSGPRIGVDYAGEDAARPYRFVWTQVDVRP